ncbi:putative sporulation protein YtxC [Paenibacillus koleovorans]|uniref:putative sporulation protein YtxC n=1 Tax=Paenibacillus koleovorans TaxID=121608 RepID=UPI0013E400A6|nr:putative sporulation protein YtxC [Paenibacillus koleovorans]
MELFTLIVPRTVSEDKESLRQRLIEAFDLIHMPEGAVQLECKTHRHFFAMQISAEEQTGFILSEWKTLIVKETAQALSAYIMSQAETKLLRDVITGTYSYEDPHDVQAIEKYCAQLLDQPEETEGMPKPKVLRQQKISSVVKSYLEEHTELDLQGLIRFRLADYRNELKEVAEYAIDEFIMDQQYQEFISLLKYFVYIQDAKIPVAHLMHRGGHEFTLLNEKMAPIDTKEFDTFTVELLDREINFEDMIVSTLISVAPQTIHIHTRDPEEQVIKTIMQIFEDRTRICTSCKGCQPVLDISNKDQLYP